MKTEECLVKAKGLLAQLRSPLDLYLEEIAEVEGRIRVLLGEANAKLEDIGTSDAELAEICKKHRTAFAIRCIKALLRRLDYAEQGEYGVSDLRRALRILNISPYVLTQSTGDEFKYWEKSVVNLVVNRTA